MRLMEQIDRWGRERPERAAHVVGGSVLTFGQLLDQSNRFAAHLASVLPVDSSPVAILGHKQHEMMIGFLGAIKAGHPYVPLDSSLPAQRTETILETARAQLFTVDRIAEIVAGAPSPVADVRLSLGTDDIWYIIFTSGSTGDPKGVMISRSCLESFMEWILDEQQFLEASEVFLNQAPFSFDLSVMDLYASLTTGGTLFSITQEETADPRRLFENLGRSQISTWVSTPSFARMCLMQPSFARAMLPQVRKFWFCGETLAPEVAAELLRRFPGAEVWNTYGPTEATVATTSMRITEQVLDRHNPLPVGRVKPGTRVVVQDLHGESVADGESGEIVIVGPNVGLGYVRRPELTARAFTEIGGQRAYRTGDSGHLSEEMLFFEGRMDFQIKLHGYRIEIGDIESNLHKLEDVRDAVVIPVLRDGRPEYLVAFAILKGTPTGSDFEMSQRLRRLLADMLPDYMVPRKFVFVPDFPTTPNGKIDRTQLSRSLQ